MATKQPGTPADGARYVGVDLAADPSRTAIATLREDRTAGVVTVEAAGLGATDDDVVDALAGADRAGVDVPFGWPEPFVEFVRAHAERRAPAPPDTDPDWRRSMALRRTDLVLRERLGLIPLSVSTDRIAYPALRWAAIEARVREGGLPVARDGTGRIAEVYPAAALRAWGLAHRGYKRDGGREARARLVDDLAALLPWLDWGAHRQACVRSDDVLDSVLAALVAREAAHGRTAGPGPDDAARARSEGWIHVPVSVPPPVGPCRPDVSDSPRSAAANLR